eukprot:scaffold19238_cov15-Tisochrysis_lutea.AAC.1
MHDLSRLDFGTHRTRSNKGVYGQIGFPCEAVWKKPDAFFGLLKGTTSKSEDHLMGLNWGDLGISISHWALLTSTALLQLANAFGKRSCTSPTTSRMADLSCPDKRGCCGA